MAKVQGGPFTAQRPFTAECFDAHIVAFIDDLFRFKLVPDGSAYQALQLDHIDNNVLSKALDFGGHAQNVGKQDTLVSLGTHGATTEAERQISGTLFRILRILSDIYT